MAYAHRWRYVYAVVAAHVIIDAGTMFLTWHQALGAEKWATLGAMSYEAVALYCKLAVGVCTTVLTLRDNTWHKAKEVTP